MSKVLLLCRQLWHAIKMLRKMVCDEFASEWNKGGEIMSLLQMRKYVY